MAVKQVFNTSAELDFPNVLPTLDLDFANSKTLDPRITFARSSGGSYVGADGLIKYAGVNEARFDHDPSTGESLGLLIEEARTNLVTWSEEFTTTPGWVKSSTVQVISNISETISPNGTFTAEKSIEGNIGPTQHAINRSGGISILSNTIYTFSVFIKAAERKYVSLLLSNSSYTNNIGATYNLIDGTVGTITYSGSASTGSTSILKLSNGWYRCSISGLIDNFSTLANVTIYTNNGTSTFYIGDGTSGIYVWGAQLEQGAFPTSYIPTQGSTRTRAADSASITGKNFSDWFNQDEGTMFVDYKLITNGSTARVFNIDNGTNNIRISGLCGNTVFQTFILPENKGPTITFPSTFNFKVASVHKDYNVFNYLNGKYFNFETGRTMIIPKTLNTLRIGNWAVNTLQGTIIKKLTYFPKRLPDAQLQALTR